MFQYFENQLYGTLGCLFLVGLFSVMWVLQPIRAMLAQLRENIGSTGSHVDRSCIT